MTHTREQTEEKQPPNQDLVEEHQPRAIEERIANGEKHDYLEDAVLGAVDGSITTFAVVAGAIGGGFSTDVIVVLGLAKLLADGFSMGVSNYLRTKSRQRRIEQARRQEEHHIKQIPAGEQQEIRQIFEEKGFEGETLERIVETITQDERLWIETMLTEELGLPSEKPRPLLAGGATFLAFILVGLLSLIPFFVAALSARQSFVSSIIITGLSFFGIGAVEGLVLDRPWLRSGIEVLLTGGGAAVLAYVAGDWLQQLFGTAAAVALSDKLRL